MSTLTRQQRAAVDAVAGEITTEAQMRWIADYFVYSARLAQGSRHGDDVIDVPGVALREAARLLFSAADRLEREGV